MNSNYIPRAHSAPCGLMDLNSAGPSRNLLSIYSTTNSILYPNHFRSKKRSESTTPSSSWSQSKASSTGHTSNKTAYQPIESPRPLRDNCSQHRNPQTFSTNEARQYKDRLIDPFVNDVHRQSMSKSSFKKENSVIHHQQQSTSLNEALQNQNNNTSIIIEKSLPNGHTTNVKGYIPKQYPKSHSVVSDRVLKTLKVRYPVEYENDGEGPREMSTTTSTFYNQKPLADSQLPSSLDELYDHNNKVRNKIFAGGFSDNRRQTKVGPTGVVDVDFHSKGYKTTYRDTVSNSAVSSKKYYRTNLYGMDHFGPKESYQVLKHLQQATTMKGKDNWTAYSKSEYPVSVGSGAPRLTEQSLTNSFSTRPMDSFGVKSKVDDPSTIHPSVLKTMKTRDPVAYDSLYNPNTMITTTQRFHNEEKLTFHNEVIPFEQMKKEVKKKAQASGFIRNNDALIVSKMKDPDLRDNPVLQSSLVNFTTYRATHIQPSKMENNGTLAPKSASSGFSKSVRTRPPFLLDG